MSQRRRHSRNDRRDLPHERPPPAAEARKAGAFSARLVPPKAEKTVPPWSLDTGGDKSPWIGAALLALLALLLRIPTLTSRSLWFDEIHTWSDAHWIPPEGRTHWLFFRIVAVFTDLLGRNEFGLRFYPFLAGVAGVLLVTVWVWRVAGRLPALLAGLALALSPTHVEFSQEGRYYAPMVLFAAGGLWAATEFFLARDWKRWLWLAALGAFLWLGRANHLTSTVLAGAIALWMLGCVVAAPWGRRLAARLVIGRNPAPKGRVIAISLVAAALLIAALWKGWGFFSGYIKNIDFNGQTPNVEFTLSFFLWNLRRFGAAIRPGSPVGAIVWVVYELGFLAGLVWLVRRRPAWAALVVGGIAATLFAVFAYPVSQPYSPKYIAFLYPLRILGFAAGWSVAIGWGFSKLKALDAARRDTLAALIFGVVLALLALPPLLNHYTRARTPIRRALYWIQEHAGPDAPIVSYGHTNYNIEFYATRIGMDADRFLVLDWPSESGRLDMGVIRAAVPSDGELYFVWGWPHDCPRELKAGLASEFVEVARFPSRDAKELDSIVYKWKFGDRLVREGRSVEWTPSPDWEAKPTSFYALYDMTLLCEAEGGGILTVDGRQLPLKSDGATTCSVEFDVAAGAHEWIWTPDSALNAPVRARISPVDPLHITIPATQVSDRGRRGEMKDDEFQGRNPLRILKNNWVDYRLDLIPGAVYELAVQGYQSPDGPCSLEARLDGQFAGVLNFMPGDGDWTDRAFAFRARNRATEIRIRLISEIAGGDGKSYPGIGAAIGHIRLRQIPDADADAVIRDDRAPIDRVVMPLAPNTPAYSASGSPRQVARQWLGKPDIFDAKIIMGEAGESNQQPSLELQFKPPYDGAVLSPPFRITPGKVLYLRIPVEVDEVYNIGATLFLTLYNGRGDQLTLYPSEGGLQDRIDWDYIYRAFQGPNRKRHVFFFEIPEGYVQAVLGVMIWPHPVPKNQPRMTITLGPPESPQRNPDLLAR